MITNKSQLTGEDSKSMDSYLAPLVQQIQPSGIRKFLIWLQVARISSLWESESLTLRPPGMLERLVSIRWKEGLQGIHPMQGCLNCGKGSQITYTAVLLWNMILPIKLLQPLAEVRPSTWRYVR